MEFVRVPSSSRRSSARPPRSDVTGFGGPLGGPTYQDVDDKIHLTERCGEDDEEGISAKEIDAERCGEDEEEGIRHKEIDEDDVCNEEFSNDIHVTSRCGFGQDPHLNWRCQNPLEESVCRRARLERLGRKP